MQNLPAAGEVHNWSPVFSFRYSSYTVRMPYFLWKSFVLSFDYTDGSLACFGKNV